MEKVNAPKIVIDGKTYQAKKPKARFWREIMAFDDSIPSLTTVEFIDQMAGIIALAFKDLTADEILDNVELDDIRKIYADLYKWVLWLLNSKMETLPKNSEAAEAAQ